MRNRANLLTARQSLNLILIVMVALTSTAFINVIYPAIKDQRPKIMWALYDGITCVPRLLIIQMVQVSSLLIETKETLFGYLENDQ